MKRNVHMSKKRIFILIELIDQIFSQNLLRYGKGKKRQKQNVCWAM